MNKTEDELINFTTLMTFTQQMMGSDKEGNVAFLFVTPDGSPNYQTVIGPALVQQLASTFATAIQSMPTLLPGIIDTPGNNELPQNPVRFFEQDYDRELLTALGMLMVRANLLEYGLINLLSTLATITPDEAMRQLLSKKNLSSKIGIVRAALRAAGIERDRMNNINRDLEKAKAVAARRNHLVHAQWSFEGTNIRATTPKKSQIVDVKLLYRLAADYRIVTLSIEGWAADHISKDQIANARKSSPFKLILDYSAQHNLPVEMYFDKQQLAKRIRFSPP